MKEKIYTIPVHDAYNAGQACPLCTLERTLTEELLTYFLGPALMEPEVRVNTNARGFCRQHWRELYNREENRLGLGLIMHTHMIDLVDDFDKGLTHSIPAGNAKLFSGRQKDYKERLTSLAEHIDNRVKHCAVCDKLDHTMERYLDVIFYEYFAEPEFRKQFDAGHGYCLPHLADLLRGVTRYLNQNQAADFMAHLARQQTAGLQALRDDVEWFTLKFDYRNADKDWKNSKDALPRTIRKLNGMTDLK